MSKLNIHGLLAHDLLLDPKACGRLRTMPVKIGKSVYHPVETPPLIEECFQLIIQKATSIKNPFEQSFFFNGSFALLAAIFRFEQQGFSISRKHSLHSRKFEPSFLC